MLANIEAVLDIDGRALQNSGKFYDLFDGTNNYSQGQLDIAKTNLTNSVTAGATLLTVDSVVGFSVGREITIQDATNIERRVISAINGNIVTVPAITNSYAANTDVYRSLTTIGNVYDSLGGLATASYANKSYTAGQESTPYAVFFRPDGLRMYVIGIGSNSVFQYNLSTAWDVTTATYQTNFGLSAQSITSAMGLWFNTDGTKMYVHDYGISRTYQYSLTTAWDVTTATYSSKFFTVSSYSGNCRSFCFSKDGTKIYYVRRGNAEIIQIPLSVAWDISTASYIFPGVTKNFSSFGYEGGGVAFSSDGRNMYAMNRTASQVYLYKLSTAWDLSTAVYSGKSFSISSQTTTANCIVVNINRDKFYIVSETGQKVYQYNLGTLTTTCDIRYNITSLMGIKEIAAWIQRDKLTGFSISTAVSIVDNAANESYTVLTPTTTDLDASTAEEEYTYGISSPEEKATLRITMSRASIADNVKLIKILGAID
jgi:sugar lactone lactonase YvrE